MWVPVVEDTKVDEHTLTVELPDGETREYTLGELKARFPTHKVTAVLQCSGNRRNDMTRHAGKTNGLQWGVGAISNAEWEGVRLSDVLADAGLKVATPAALTREPHPQSTGPPTSAAGREGALAQDDDDDDSLEGSTADPRIHHVQFSGLEAYGASIPRPRLWTQVVMFC
jgi:sulfite oxidase